MDVKQNILFHSWARDKRQSFLTAVMEHLANLEAAFQNFNSCRTHQEGQVMSVDKMGDVVKEAAWAAGTGIIYAGKYIQVFSLQMEMFS